jgi:hypothetical protein
MATFKRYVVQTQFKVEQFDHYDLALKFAEQHGFAALYRGQDVTEIQGSCVTLRNGHEKFSKIWAGQQPKLVGYDEEV